MRDNLSRVIVGATLALALLTIGGIPVFGSLVAFGETVPLLPLEWVQPTAQSFMILSALATAMLCFGRYRALGGAWVYWTGAAFLANAILGVFYLLSWPGLLGDRGVIAQLPNTASWFFIMHYSCIALLLIAVNARQPERQLPSPSFAGYAIAALVAFGVGLLSVWFERGLPVLVVGGVFTTLTLVLSGLLILLIAVAAASAYRRYQTGHDVMLGYLALFLVLTAFGILESILGGKRYDIWWYFGRAILVGAYLVVLYGFLQEGWALFGRELTQAQERERLLRQRRESDERLLAVLDTVVDGIVTIDEGGTIQSFNLAAEHIFGYSAAEALGQSVAMLMPEPYRSEHGRYLEHYLRTGQARIIGRGREVVGRRRDGSVFPLDLAVSEMRLDGHRLFTGIVRDITERKQAEQELAAARQRLAADLDAMTRLQAIGALFVRESAIKPVLDQILEAAIAITDADMGNIQLLDPQSGDLKIAVHRGFEQPFIDFWNTVSKGQGACGTALGCGERVIVEDVTRSPIFAGTPALQVQLEAGVRAVQSTPLSSRSGEPLGMFSTHFKSPHRPDERALRLLDLLSRQAADIIERARAEESLRESEERFRAMVDSIPQLAWMAHANGFIFWYNRRWYEYTGTTPEQMEGWGWQSVHDPEMLPKVLERWKASIATGEPFDMEFPLRGADGQFRWFLTRVTPLKDEQGRVVRWFGTNTDVDEKREAEAERERLLAELEATVEAAAAGVVAYDRSGRIARMNAAAARIMGYSAADMALPMAELFARLRFETDDGRALSFEQFPPARALRGERVASVAMAFHKDNDGSDQKVWIYDGAGPIRLPEGEIVGAVVSFVDITGRKRLEEALRESEERFRSLFEDSPVSLWEEDFSAVKARLDGLRRSGVSDFPTYLAEHPEEVARCAALVRVVDVNRATLAMYGAPSKASMIAPLPGVFDGESYPVFAAELAELADGKMRFRAETVNRRLDGKRIAIDLIWQVMPGYEHDLAKVVVSIVDITERKRADEERERLLREGDAQRQRFEAVVEHAPAGIALLRPPDFVFELVNPAYQAIGPDLTMTGKTVAEVFPDLAEEVLPILEDVVRTGRPFGAVDRHFQVRREPQAAPEDVYFTFFYEPMLDAEGRVEIVLVLVNETTQQVLVRKRVEELADVAQRRAAELQAVLDNMVDAVFVCAPDGRIVLSNPAASRMFGLPSFAAIKNLPAEFPTLLRLRHPDGRPIASSEMATARALAGQTVLDAEQTFHSPQFDQDRYVRVSALPIRNAESKIVGAVVVARDVTALTELDRLKEQFISVAAHELKTPVTIMKGYAQTLERASVDLPLPARRMIDAIDHGADRIDRIVKDLLDVSRLQAGQLELADERIDLAQLAEDVVDRFALTTTTKHRPRVVQVDPAVIRGDRGRIEEVLADLLDNAVRYSPAGGDVDVAVRVEGDRAVVSVRDQGVGIPRAKQDRIFERFYRAHTRTQYDYGGMGVGLYIAREVIARHGGQMWFESKEGQGSTFYFGLPLTRE